MDNYGRTAFHLALGLNNLEAAKALLAYNPRVDIQDNEGFTAWDEVVITKDEELIKSVFKFQETDRLLAVLKGIGHTFATFAAVPDFYYELKWSITGRRCCCCCCCCLPLFENSCFKFCFPFAVCAFVQCHSSPSSSPMTPTRSTKRATACASTRRSSTSKKGESSTSPSPGSAPLSSSLPVF